MKQNRLKGFTLIELMVCVAIVGILAAISYPSYRGHVIKSKQSEAKTALVSFASAMGQYYMEDMTYLGAAGSSGSPTNTGTPWVFTSRVPFDGGTKTYDLTIQSASQSAFKLKAAPVGASLNTYCINEVGTKDDCSGNSNW